MPIAGLERPADTRIDLPSFYAGDYDAVFAWLRRNDPVHWQPENELWVLTRHACIREVAADTETFSNNYGVTVGAHAIARELWESAGHAGRADRGWQLAELRRQIGRRSSAAPDIDTLQFMDPPAHSALRKIFVRSFTPGALRPLEDRVRELTRSVLNEISAGDTGDFIDLLAAPVPIYVIAELLGVAKEDRDDFRRWSDVVISAVEPKGDEARARDAAQLEEMFAYFREQVVRRRTEPQDDLLTLMVESEVDGAPLSPKLVETLAKLILSAGNETTRSSISGTALALAQFPDQRARLVREPELIPDAVNEFLRWTTPVRAFCRTATRDTVLRDRKITRGDYLALSFASANRDGDVWSDPDSLDVTRHVQPGHLAFNHGPHVCLGQSLARLEMKVVVQELLARFPSFELAGDLTLTPSTMVNSIRSMPVTFR
jgi:cytochrome P450